MSPYFFSTLSSVHGSGWIALHDVSSRAISRSRMFEGYTTHVWLSRGTHSQTPVHSPIQSAEMDTINIKSPYAPDSLPHYFPLVLHQIKRIKLNHNEAQAIFAVTNESRCCRWSVDPLQTLGVYNIALRTSPRNQEVERRAIILVLREIQNDNTRQQQEQQITTLSRTKFEIK